MNIGVEYIRQLSAHTETDSVEFKRSTGQLERGMETLCAFLNWGRGIRLMVDECKDAGLEAPVFMSSVYQVTAIFYRRDFKEDLSSKLSDNDNLSNKLSDKLHDKINDKINDLHLTDNQRKVYEYLNQKSESNGGNMIKLTISVIKTETGLSYPTVQRILKDFENMNIVRHIGAKKRGSWILIDKQ